MSPNKHLCVISSLIINLRLHYRYIQNIDISLSTRELYHSQIIVTSGEHNTFIYLIISLRHINLQSKHIIIFPILFLMIPTLPQNLILNPRATRFTQEAVLPEPQHPSLMIAYNELNAWKQRRGAEEPRGPV